MKLHISRTVLTYLVISIAGVVGLVGYMNTPAYADDAGWLSPNITGVRDKTVFVEDAAKMWTNHTEQCVPKDFWSGNPLQPDKACVYRTKSFSLARVYRCTPNWYGNCDHEEWMSIDSGKGYEKVVDLNALSSTSCWHTVATRDQVIQTCTEGLGIIDNMPLSSTAHHLQNASEITAKISEAAVSNNGEWLVGEIYTHGLFKLHLTDGTVQMITKESHSRGLGMDPSYEFSISNDGQYIVVGGLNLGADIYKVNDSCGIKTTNYQVEWDNLGDSFVKCPSLGLYEVLKEANGGGDERLKMISHMKFSDDGKTLELFEQMMDKVKGSYTWWVKLALPDGTAPLDYLALGDSISSGEGDTAKDKNGNKYYVNHSDVEQDKGKDIPREKCHQSSRSYPFFLARSMGLTANSPRQWGDVACSGAKATDISSDTQFYEGQGQGKGPLNMLGEPKVPRLHGFSNRVELQASALNEFIPGRVEQIEFVRKYKPKVITLTAGANDIDFANKLSDCASIHWLIFVPHTSTCGWATTKISSLAGQIRNEYPILKSLYEDLYKASGDRARIYVIGYPQIISKDEPGKCGGNIGYLNDKERKMIYNATEYLNTVIEHAANAAGAHYIDVSSSLSGGKLCDDGQVYMNGVIMDPGKNEQQESFHPNYMGHIMMTTTLRKSIMWEDLRTYNPCSDSPTKCNKTDDEKSEPDVPENLGGVAKNSKAENLTRSTLIKGESVDITIPSNTLKPGDAYDSSIHSDPIDLGTRVADSMGGGKFSIEVPTSLPAGYHTLIIEGKAMDGEPLELTQSLEVLGNNPEDRDENGILDDKQRCGLFLTDDACDIVNIDGSSSGGDMSQDNFNPVGTNTKKAGGTGPHAPIIPAYISNDRLLDNGGHTTDLRNEGVQSVLKNSELRTIEHKGVKVKVKNNLPDLFITASILIISLTVVAYIRRKK